VESLSDYQRYFQPFYVRQDVSVAPIHKFARDEATRQTSAGLVDDVLARPDLYLPRSGNFLASHTKIS
jgi:hypothetical protein